MRHIPGSVGRSVGMTDLPNEMCVHETHLHFWRVQGHLFVHEHQKLVCPRTNELKWTKFACVLSFLVVFFAFFAFVNTARTKFSLCLRTKRGFPVCPPNSGDVVSRTGQVLASPGLPVPSRASGVLRHCRRSTILLAEFLLHTPPRRRQGTGMPQFQKILSYGFQEFPAPRVI